MPGNLFLIITILTFVSVVESQRRCTWNEDECSLNYVDNSGRNKTVSFSYYTDLEMISQSSKDGMTYVYSLCGTVEVQPACNESKGCQEDEKTDHAMPLGTTQVESCYLTEQGNPILTFKPSAPPNDTVEIGLAVTFLCDKTKKGIFLEERGKQQDGEAFLFDYLIYGSSVCKTKKNGTEIESTCHFDNDNCTLTVNDADTGDIFTTDLTPIKDVPLEGGAVKYRKSGAGGNPEGEEYTFNMVLCGHLTQPLECNGAKVCEIASDDTKHGIPIAEYSAETHCSVDEDNVATLHFVGQNNQQTELFLNFVDTAKLERLAFKLTNWISSSNVDSFNFQVYENVPTTTRPTTSSTTPGSSPTTTTNFSSKLGTSSLFLLAVTSFVTLLSL